MNKHVELCDPDLTGTPVIWTGTLGEFLEANAEFPPDDEALETLEATASVLHGGGAEALFLLRYAA